MTNLRSIPTLSRRSILGMALLIASAVPALAGPPLICHPFDIGTAASLPFGSTSEGWRGWQATLAGTYHTGWPTTPLRLVVPETGASEWVAGPRNADRLGAFASVDLRVSRDFVLRHGTLNVFVEATNLTDRANHCCTDFSFEPTGTGALGLSREYRDWLPLVPNVGVLWKY